MRFIIVVCGVAILFMVPAFGFQKDFSPEGAEFSVHMPGTPECEDLPVTTSADQKFVRTCRFFDRKKQVLFQAQYFPTKSVSAGVNPDTVLALGRDRILMGANTQLLSEHKITVDGRPGIECVMRAKGEDFSVHMRLILTNRQMAIVGVIGSERSIRSPGVRSFLDSVRLK